MNTKKITALILTLLIAVSAFSTNTLAATWDPDRTTGSLEIIKTDKNRNPLEGVEYTIYHVANITQTTGPNVSIVYNSLVPGMTITSATTAADFDPVDLADLTSHAQKTDEDGSTTFQNLPLGLYLAVETELPAGAINANNFLISIPMSVNGQNWLYDVVAEPKNIITDATIEKEIIGGTSVNGTPLVHSANIGDTITYEITAKLPSNLEEENYTLFNILDTPGPELSIDIDSIAINVGPVGLIRNTDYTVTPNGSGFTISLINSGNHSDKLHNNAVVTVMYNATVTDDAVPGVAFTNGARIVYEIGNTGAIGTIPPTEPPTDVYTYSYTILKVDENGDALPGAGFIIQNLDGGTYMAWDGTAWGATSRANATVFTSDANGHVNLSGLAEGDYRITEVNAPAGYTLLRNPIDIRINAATTGETYSTTVVDTPQGGITLPETGGIGIYIFTIGGALLIAAAVIYYLRARRKSSENQMV